jgi:TRAP-type C4-dicarboxylate transport system permease small subunit
MKFLNKLEESFIMAAFAIMGIVLALQIFMRYVVNSPLIWSEEMARYIFVWGTFIGAGYGVRNKIHISMELLYIRLPKKLRLVVTLFTNVLSILVFAYLIPWGFVVLKDQANIKSSAMQIPMPWVFAAVPIGCFIVCLRLIGDTVIVIKTKGENL